MRRTQRLTYLFLLFLPCVALGQNYFITNGTINACGGSFQDDNNGGAEGSPYSSSDYTFTICPDNPGDAIQISFAAFNLQSSPNPNNSDRLFIYDGNSVAANSLGSYSGNQLQGLDVTATISNPTGCLTFVFVCNTNNTNSFPGWEGLISCETPCATPVSVSEIVDPVPQNNIQSVGVCMNQELTFSDNGSFAQPGFNIVEYVWNFDDGTIDNTSGPEVTHSFPEPGEYIVTLTVVDNNGCNSLNLDPLQVLVSTIPEFNTEFEEVTCLGEDLWLDGNPVQSTTWTALPPQVVAGETYLADGAGFAYSTSLVFDFFEPDAVLEDCSDLLSILVNMEHSYMGDLEVQLTCPDGTTVIMVDFPNNGGGGTFLGEAIDDGSVTPGVGYDYWWAPDANSGTWGENAGGFNQSLPSGVYESAEDLCSFVGCPLNGEWTLTITDNLAIDNGYIFYWGLNFNPELYPGITTFTPIIGMGPDSTYWEGPFITDTSPDGNYITVMPPNVGLYDYTFYATNNFGCTFDTTITVEVVPAPSVFAGDDITVCGDIAQLLAEVTVEGNVSDCQYTLIMEDSFGDGWNGHTLQIWADGALQLSEALDFADYEEAAFTIDGGANFEVILQPGGFNEEIAFSIVDSYGNLLYSAGPGGIPTGIVLYNGVCGGFGNYIYEWSPADGLSNPNIADPLVEVNQTTQYTLTVYPDGYPGCVASDEVTVAIDPASDPGQDSSIVVCFNYGEFHLFDMLGGNPVTGGEWTDQNGILLSDDIFDPYVDQSNVFTYTVSNGGCITFAQVAVMVIPLGDPACCEFSYDITPANETCSNFNDGTLEVEIYESTEGAPWNVEIIMGNQSVAAETINGGPFTFTGLAPGEYTMVIIDNGFCLTTETFQIGEPEPMLFTVSQDTLICVDGIAVLSASSTMDDGTWFYTWDNGIGNGENVFVSPPIQTTYSVFATSGSGCISSPMDVTVSVRDSLSIAAISDTLICIGGTAMLDVALAQGGIGGPYTYLWTQNGFQLSNEESFSFNPLESTVFCVQLSDACESPTVTDCIVVTVEEPIVPLFETDTTQGCIPLEINFSNLIESDRFESLIWLTGDGATYNGNTFSHTYEYSGMYDVGLTYTSPIGCVYSGSFNNYIVVYPNPVAGFHAEPQPTMIPDTEINFYDYSVGSVVEWDWDFAGLGFSSDEDPVWQFPSDVAGEYPVTLTVTDINGCVDSVYRIVQVNDFFSLYVPNAFTPNNDGINDVFFVHGSDINPERFKLWIYNRWGELVFYTEDIDAVWTGNFEGGEYYVQDGVYQWRIEVYSETTADRREFFGTVTAIR